MKHKTQWQFGFGAFFPLLLTLTQSSLIFLEDAE